MGRFSLPRYCLNVDLKPPVLSSPPMKNCSEGICTDSISDSVDCPREAGTLAWVELHCGSKVYRVVMVPSLAPDPGCFIAELPR